MGHQDIGGPLVGRRVCARGVDMQEEQIHIGRDRGGHVGRERPRLGLGDRGAASRGGVTAVTVLFFGLYTFR